MKTAKEYIKELPNSIRENILRAYYRMITNRDLKDLNLVMKEVLELKSMGYTAQYIGKFRSIIFEEYVTLILKDICKPLGNVMHQVKIPLKGYDVIVDVVVMSAKSLVMIVECKVDLDASRLKVALGEYILINKYHSDTSFLIVYFNSLISEKLMEIAKEIVPIVHISNLKEYLEREFNSKVLKR